jgi:hypothetical protein
MSAWCLEELHRDESAATRPLRLYYGLRPVGIRQRFLYWRIKRLTAHVQDIAGQHNRLRAVGGSDYDLSLLVRAWRRYTDRRDRLQKELERAAAAARLT